MTRVTLTATYDCAYWPEDAEDPTEWGGWCDPRNPWGTADDTYDASDAADAYGRGEPIALTLPLVQAARFVVDYPGGVWDYSDDGESECNYRTGVYTRVMLHVDRDSAATVFALADRMA